MYMYVCMYVYIYIYIYIYPCPKKSYKRPAVPFRCTHFALQNILGMDMGMNVTAHKPENSARLEHIIIKSCYYDK